MALQTQELVRAFRYNNMDLADPGMQYSTEQVKAMYSATYAEIVNAAIEGPEEKDGKMIYTFRRAVGTKGIEPKNAPAESARRPAPPPDSGASMILRERMRQIGAEGYTADHDDEHDDNSLALAACAYAAPVPLFRQTRRIDQGGQRYAECWPESWLRKYDKRKYIGDLPAPANMQIRSFRIRCLVKAGALIAAEIDRMLRLGNP